MMAGRESNQRGEGCDLRSGEFENAVWSETRFESEKKR